MAVYTGIHAIKRKILKLETEQLYIIDSIADTSFKRKCHKNTFREPHLS